MASPILFRGRLNQLVSYSTASDGSGPSPAIVLLRGCSGAGAYAHGWAAWFAEQGYVALVVDSLAPRHVTTVCPSIVDHPTTEDQALDGYGALAYLSSLPTVASGRIGVTGWSHGGSATLNAVDRGFVAAHPGGGFRAAFLVLSDLPLVPRRRRHRAAARAAGKRRRLEPARPAGVARLQRATHAFDVPGRDRIVYVGNEAFHLWYDPEAAADAHARVLAFFGERLR